MKHEMKQCCVFMPARLSVAWELCEV